MDDRLRVTVVCSGNICRSPIGEFVLRRAFQDAGLSDSVLVDSAGIGSWHVGDGADRRSVRVLAAHGLDASTHEVRQITAAWFDDDAAPDLLLAMDSSHHQALRRIAPDVEVRMLREFDPALADRRRDEVDLDVPDPYYGAEDDFEDVYSLVVAAAVGVVTHVRTRLARP
jgi:protein-tyrosine phosphatase